MKTYCLACRKLTNNVVSWNTTMTNKVIRNKSKRGVCLSDNSRFIKKKDIKKALGNIIKQIQPGLLILYNLDSLIVHVDRLLKINKEFKNLCKQGIQIIFTKMNWIKLLFNMI